MRNKFMRNIIIASLTSLFVSTPSYADWKVTKSINEESHIAFTTNADLTCYEKTKSTSLIVMFNEYLHPQQNTIVYWKTAEESGEAFGYMFQQYVDIAPLESEFEFYDALVDSDWIELKTKDMKGNMKTITIDLKGFNESYKSIKSSCS